MTKKRFTFSDAKAKIKELEDKLETLNVDLSDNIVTEAELKVLKIYKYVTFVLAGFILLIGVFALF